MGPKNSSVIFTIVCYFPTPSLGRIVCPSIVVQILGSDRIAIHHLERDGFIRPHGEDPRDGICMGGGRIVFIVNEILRDIVSLKFEKIVNPWPMVQFHHR